MSEMTAKDIFEGIKNNKSEISFDDLRKNRNNLLPRANKVLKTGQKRVAKNMLLTLTAIGKEMMAVTEGYNIYVDKHLLFEYMEKCNTRSVVINYLKDFPREVPNDVVEKIEILKEKSIFDEFVIVFTDYTGEERSKVNDDLREKDPIIFGIFCDLKEKFVYDRFYFIADWEDEFCDLTLDKLIVEQRDINPDNPIQGVATLSEFEDSDVDEILEKLENVATNKPIDLKDEENKSSFFGKLKSLFKK